MLSIMNKLESLTDFFVVVVFLGTYLRHMEIPKLGDELEL